LIFLRDLDPDPSNPEHCLYLTVHILLQLFFARGWGGGVEGGRSDLTLVMHLKIDYSLREQRHAKVLHRNRNRTLLEE
jgi:hypothetical protein